MEISNKISNHAFFKIALNDALKHPFRNEVKSIHSALVVRGGNIISRGLNRPKRNVFSRLYSKHPRCVIHSEIDAILQARRKSDLRGAKIYVLRIRKDNAQVANSRPCANCMRAIKNYGIKKVIYTIDGNDFESFNLSEYGKNQ